MVCTPPTRQLADTRLVNNTGVRKHVPAPTVHMFHRYGEDQWVIKNASFIKIPGTYDYEDVLVLPDKMNIKAGAGWFHQINGT